MLLSPQAERNWESLCSVLENVLEHQSHRQLFALELGSGTGQHVIRFAQKMPFVTWQPSDIKEESLDRFVSYYRFLIVTDTNIYSWSKWLCSSHAVKFFTVSIMGNRFYIFQLCGYETAGSGSGIANWRIKSACLLAVLKHTLLQPMRRLCCSQSTWMPANRGSNGQAFLATPVMLLLPLTYCNTAPSKQQR